MRALVRIVRRADLATVQVARTSQALLIAAADRLARSDSGHPRVLGRLWAVQLDLADLFADEPIRVIDGTYAQLQRLLSLHREFANRVFEAMDIRERPPAESSSAEIIPPVHGWNGRA